MNDKPLVSVIMGVYNSNTKKLSKAIDSILNQSFSDFEFLICDDCSTNCQVMSLLTYYEEKDRRIIVLHNKKNSGLAASLNHCLTSARGNLIARMDDDDWSLPERFQKQVDFLKKCPVDFVGSNAVLFNEQGAWGHAKNNPYPQKTDFLIRSPFIHPTIMVRREAYDKVEGYREDKHTRRTEDYDMFMRMYAKGVKGANIQEELYCYFMNEDTYKKQKFKYRIDEMIIRYGGFKNMDLFPKGLPYVVKPIISYFIPSSFKIKKQISK